MTCLCFNENYYYRLCLSNHQLLEYRVLTLLKCIFKQFFSRIQQAINVFFSEQSLRPDNSYRCV